jgi:hypothetical protein
VCEPSPIFNPVKPELLALFSYLKRHGVDDVALLDLECESLSFPRYQEELAGFIDACSNVVASYDYDIMAISCFSTYSYQSALMFARISRRIRPEALVVVGGWHSLSESRDFIVRENLFDFVVSGAGEKPLLDIAQGRTTRGPNGTEIITAQPLTPADCAKFEYLYREYAEQAGSRYFSAFQTAPAAMLPISRGCPYGCVFCGNSLQARRNWTALTVDRCISLIGQAKAAQPKLDTCYFSDAFFGVSRKWRREFLAEYARTFPDFPNVVITRVDFIEPPDVERFARSRTFVLLGVESLSCPVLDIMRKTRHPGQYIERTREVIQWLREGHVPHELFMILDHPGETEETLAETRSNLEKVLGPFTSVVGFRYIHFPQFAHRYAEYQQRFGTELQAPLFWWREPAFCARSLSDRYVPSKRDSESFDVAKERMERAIAPYESLCREYARRTPHGNVVRRDMIQSETGTGRSPIQFEICHE